MDNPHTKPVAFWEELITTVQRQHPDVIFLAEAFTDPRDDVRVLGKVGFTKTILTWRESKAELTEYATELDPGEMRWYYRGNFWPNTPDILPGHLQNAGPQMFRLRAALAATLSSTSGNVLRFQLCEDGPYPGKEEYDHSEGPQLVARDWNAPGNIKAFIRQLNRIRRENPAMHLYDNLRFHHADHGDIICYSKCTPDFTNRVLCIVSLNAQEQTASTVRLDLAALGLAPDGYPRHRPPASRCHLSMDRRRNFRGPAARWCIHASL